MPQLMARTAIGSEEVGAYMEYLEKTVAPIVELPEDELQNSTRSS